MRTVNKCPKIHNKAHALDAGLCLCFIQTSSARASDARRWAAMRVQHIHSVRQYLVGALLCISVTGCFIPHIGRSSPSLSGRVVDANSLRPVGGAKITFPDHPETSTRTDDSGSFHLPATHRFYWLVLGACPVDYPSGWRYGILVEVSHPQYESIQLSWLTYDLDNKKSKDIFLKPVAK